MVLAVRRDDRVRSAVVRQGRALRQRTGRDDDAGARSRWAWAWDRCWPSGCCTARSAPDTFPSRRWPWRSSPLDLHLASSGRVSTGALANIPAFLAQSGSWRILADLVGLAIAGGLFTVPLYAILQHESEPAHRARVIAANNIINALAMSVAAVAAAAFLARGMSMGELFGLCGVATLPVALVVGVDPAAHARQEPGATRAAAAVSRRGRRPRARPSGDAARGDRRQSRVVPRRPAARRVSARRPDLRRRHVHREAVVGASRSCVFVNALPVDPTNPLSIRAMIRAVEAGLGLHHLPRGPHHDDRLADEGLRRAGRHRRADEGRASPDSHRRRRVHAVLAARGQGPSAPPAEDPDSRAAAASA